MAEIAVEEVLNKLDNAELREVLLLYNFGYQVEFVMRELRQIRSFLKDADSRGQEDEGVRNWARDVMNVAYKIDNAVNTFRGDLKLGRGKETGFCSPLKEIENFLRRRHACNELRKQIDEICITFRNISEDRNRYDFMELDETSWWRVRSRRLIPPIDNLNVVGFEAHIRSIIDLLLDESNSRRSEIIIAGMGGLGKTTLAKIVYESEEVWAHFHCRIWLPFSRENSFIGLLRRMQRCLGIGPNESNVEEEEYLMAEINRSLREKKYLVVLDDVWTGDLLNKLKMVLPDSNNGSRMLMTTRNKDVYLMDVAMKVRILYELQFLNDEESKELLLRKALPRYHYTNENYPVYLMDVAMKLAKKCEGLPLALVEVGDLLKGTTTVEQWDRVLSTMEWHLEGKKCLDILAISFEDLPHFLKSCFVYCACLCRDFNITAKNIIKMWVAEGFIRQDARRTMEDTADMYLEELAQRCLVQVTNRYSHGAIKSFRIHVLFHELAIPEAKSNKFILKYENHIQGQDLAEVRRVAFHSEVAKEDVLQEIQIPNVRTIVASDVSVPIGRHKFLAVLELRCSKNLIELPTELMGIFNLKYLGLRSTGLTEIPETIGNLENLQTLDVKDTIIESLPDSLWGIRSLRHVHVSDRLDHVDGPPPSANLENIFSLKIVRVRKTWRQKLPHLPRVRKLGLSCCRITNDPNWEPNWVVVSSLLATLENLVSLVLRGPSIPATVIDVETSPSYQNLASLFLCGSMSRLNLDGIKMPPKLIKLTLQEFVLEQAPLTIVGNLERLKTLRLITVAVRGEMIFLAGGFPELRKLEIIASWGLENWGVDEQALPKLEQLHIRGCTGLKVLPDLQCLTNLREFDLSFPTPELKEKLVQNPTYGVPRGYQLHQCGSAEFRLSAMS